MILMHLPRLAKRFCLLWVVCLLFFCPLGAQEGNGDAKPQNGIDTDAVAQAVSGITGLPFHSSIQVKTLTRAELLPLIEADINLDTPPEKFEVAEAILKRFGLLSPELKLRKTLLSLLGGQIAGFYLPRKKTLYLIDDMPLSSMIAAHEITHALQDQSFDLQAIHDSLKHNDDRLLAFTSVIEGEACIAMLRYMMEKGSKLELFGGLFVSALISEAQMEGLRNAPLVLREQLMFPYEAGQRFVQEALRRGGRSGIRRLYRKMPESTEQILHADKYFDQVDRPTSVDMGDLATVLGKAWTLREQNTLGELGCAVLLEAQGVARVEARTAACGWDGDRYQYLEQEKNDGKVAALVWLSTWDSAGHAYRFQTAMSEALGRTWKRKKQVKGTREAWTRDEKSVIMLSRWGSEVLLLNGVPPAQIEQVFAQISSRKTAGTLFAPDHRHDAASTEDEEAQAPVPAAQATGMEAGDGLSGSD